jgi:hypothetical protein
VVMGMGGMGSGMGLLKGIDRDRDVERGNG